jgi:hypothetical protein
MNVFDLTYANYTFLFSVPVNFKVRLLEEFKLCVR